MDWVGRLTRLTWPHWATATVKYVTPATGLGLGGSPVARGGLQRMIGTGGQGATTDFDQAITVFNGDNLAA